jgi:hypothetical protein
LISLKFPVGRRWQAGQTFDAEIWAVNDSRQVYTNCELQIRLDDDLIHTQRLDLPPDSSRCVGGLACRLTQQPEQISLCLRHEDEILAQNRYDLNWTDRSKSPFTARLRRWIADWVLR